MPKKNPDIRIIKKYSNRRLYDSNESKYITLEDLKDLVLSGENFKVVTKDDEDVTDSTLINILLSCEFMGQPMFSEQGLRNMIMLMHGPMRGPMRILFEQCMPLLNETHQRINERFGNVVDSQIAEGLCATQAVFVRQLMEQYICKNLESYLEAQKNIGNAMNFPPFNFQNLFNLPPDQKK